MTDNDYTREDVLRHAGFTLDIDTSQMLRDYAALLARVERAINIETASDYHALSSRMKHILRGDYP